MQGALPALEARRLDGRRPGLAVDVDHDGVREAGGTDPLAKPVQRRRTGRPDDHRGDPAASPTAIFRFE